MKTTAKFWMLLFVINSFVLMMPQKAIAQASINFQVFYDNLSPHGYWVDNSTYGYVWVPNVAPGFTPYGSNGYWVYSNVGWTWVSNYSWGWAPFHYGRWFYDPFYGWLWVPGYEWGPGWVVWRSSPSYYGWAPIGPGISINLAYSSGYQAPYNQWVFVSNSHMGRTNIYNYYVSPSRNTEIIRNSRVINNIRHDNSSKVRYNAGPDRAEVQKATKRSISPVTLKERNKPGQSMKSNELQVYRPEVAKSRSTPSKVAKWKEARPTVQKENATRSRNDNSQVNQSQTREKRTIQPVQSPQMRERRNNQQSAKQQVQQQRSNPQPARQERPVSPQKQQQARERPDNQQSIERQMHEQRNSQQVRQERTNQQIQQQQMPQQLPANTQTRQQQQLPQPRNNAPMQKQMPQRGNESNPRGQR